jgi:hypothetical protein
LGGPKNQLISLAPNGNPALNLVAVMTISSLIECKVSIFSVKKGKTIPVTSRGGP